MLYFLKLCPVQLQILGFMVAIMFFGMMRQTSAWECDSSVPSILSAIESNLGLPKAFTFLCFMPILVFFAFLIFTTEQKPPLGTFLLVTIICYIVANGFAILLILSSKLFLYAVAILHVFTKRRLVYTFISFCLSICLFSFFLNMMILQIFTGFMSY